VFGNSGAVCPRHLSDMHPARDRSLSRHAAVADNRLTVIDYLVRVPNVVPRQLVYEIVDMPPAVIHAFSCVVDHDFPCTELSLSSGVHCMVEQMTCSYMFQTSHLSVTGSFAKIEAMAIATGVSFYGFKAS
jgi:hypothetical protein